MSEIDINGAVEALTAELPDEPVDAVVSSDSTIVEDNQPEAESFTGFDPTILPEDMQAVYKSMQADYTRKTQEVAELRRSYESFSEAGVDPDAALQAVGFLQELNTNPNFALEVAEQIRLNAGTPDVSDNIYDTTPDDNNGYENLPPALAVELEQMRQFREEMLDMQAQQETMAELEAMESTIRTANPNYTDDDMEAVYSLAYATDGDLMAAQQQYHAIQQRLLGGYLQSKQVPHGATPAPASPSSVPHPGFKNLDEAHRAAMEVARNIS
jgi:hypothetical protein